MIPYGIVANIWTNRLHTDPEGLAAEAEHAQYIQAVHKLGATPVRHTFIESIADEVVDPVSAEAFGQQLADLQRELIDRSLEQ
jgi:hypothetical protein